MRTKHWIVLGLVGVLLPSLSWAVTAEEMFRSLRGLSPERRAARLLAQAKEEGKVTWYATTNNRSLQKFAKGFNRRYPGIKVEWVRGKSHQLLNRLMAEARAGKPIADISNSGGSGTMTLISHGLLIPVETPARDAYGPDFKDDKGYWVDMNIILSPFAYNTDLVRPEEAPRSFADLLNPRWKGKMALDSRPNRLIPVLLQEWGEERTLHYLKKLALQEPAIVRGHTAAAQLLAAGQYQILIEPFSHSTLRLKHQGAPIDIAWQREFVPGAYSALLGMLKKAPHPHAALLLYEYILSGEGQQIFVDEGRIPTRTGLHPRYPELKGITKRVRLALIKPENAAGNLKRVSSIMKKIFLRQ